MDKDYRGKVFVRGLFVGEMDDLKYGYNFNPGILPLDRDRRVLPSFDTLYATSNMWSEVESDLIVNLLKEGAKDVSYVGGRTLKVIGTPIADAAYKKFIDANGEFAYPVSSDLELKALALVAPEYKPVIVSSSYSSFLFQTGKFPEINIRHMSTIKGRLELWRDKVMSKLTEEELEELNELINYVWN